ncbi:MAG: DUF2341 domain-containing protein, partial [Candidatus Hodarchaeales archaeon]
MVSCCCSLKPPSLGGLEGSDLFNGTIDEFRVSGTSRSLDWITTVYENQNNPSSFNSIGSLETPSPIGNWAYPWLAHRKDLIINSNKVQGSLVNFPVLVHLYDSDLASSSSVQDDGDDIAFADDQGNRLDHEIELFNKHYNSSYSELIAWVRLPNLSNFIETIISMYYGNLMTGPQENPAGVWDPDFKGVWHLSDDPSATSPQIKDSTSNNNDGTTYGSMTSDDQVSGRIGGSLDFDGINDYINFSDDISLNMGSGDFSFELWFELETVTGPEPLGGKGLVGSGGKRYSISVGPNAECSPGQIKGEIDDDTSKEYAKSSARYDDSIWHYVVLVRDGTNLKLYIDGTEIVVEPIGNKPFLLGRIDPLIEHFSGKFDEVRISNVAYSSDWIVTSWNNQNNSNSFYSVGGVETNPYFDDWAYPWLQYRKSIQINSNKISGRLSDFPLLVDINDTDLFNSSKVQIDGRDIAFGDAIGTRLPHEIESFNQAGNGTHAHLIAWVRIPNLSSTKSNSIFMYYGNKAVYNQEKATNVWNSNYAGVWHLGDDPSPYYYDSTINSNNGVGLNSPLNDTTSKIDGGISFDDSNDRAINISHSSSLTLPTNITVSAWINTTNTDGNVNIVVNKWGLTTSERNYWLGKLDDQLFAFYVDDTYNVQFPLSNFNDGEWHYVVCTATSTGRLTMYLDGTLVNSSRWDGTSTTGTNDFHIGKAVDTVNQEFDGDIDEVRISSNARSIDWVITEFNNQYDPVDFYSLGIEEETLRWADSSFSMKMDIGINNTKVSGTLIDFPLLVDITNNNLKTGKLQVDADDLLFICLDETKLDHEIEFFSQDSVEGHLIAWVRLPLLSNSQYNLISMYYNNPDLPSQENPTKVWNANFKGVWHLNNDPADP